MIHKVDLTGDYETDPGDTVETWRDGKQSMSGVIGELAKWQAVFAATGPRLVRHEGCILARLTAETSSPVHSGIPALCVGRRGDATALLGRV